MQPRAAFAVREVAAVAVAFTALLLAVSDRYGYHRDELYFRVIGAHPALGYVDQPPLVPLLDHAMDVLGGQSLVWLRVPPALAGALVVLLTGRIAADLGGERAAQLLAAGCTAVSCILLLSAHLASTTIFDLLAWTLISWLVVRALTGAQRYWLAVGAVAGVALEIKTLPIFLLFALTVGVLAVGPRAVFASRWLWAGTAVAMAQWAPNLAWQATHGWPQLQLSSDIASGSSGTSQPRWLFVPYQGVLVSPLLVPVWVAGLWRLWRTPPWRAFPVAFVVLAVVFVAVGGKPYYQCGLYPVLLAAGSTAAVEWARGARWRGGLVAAAVTLSAVVDATLMLPLVPASDLRHTPIVAVNYDTGEQVGWPRFAATVAEAYRTTRAQAVLTGNYGEAGALARYRPSVPVFGTQNSDWDLGRPRDGVQAVVAVGFDVADLRRWFATTRVVARIDNGVGVDDDEQDEPVYVCTGPRAPWHRLWPELRRLG